MVRQGSSTRSCSLCDTLRKGKDRFVALYDVLGIRFLCVTILIEHVLQAFIAGGGSGGLIGAPIFLLLTTFQLTASRMQVLESVAVSSWQLKPLIGILSDNIYVGGYNRMPYMIATSLMGIAASFILVAGYPWQPLILVVLWFFIFLPIATCDLLLEARYVEKLRDMANVRPTLQSFIRFCSGFCELASIGLVGLLIAYNVPLQWVYLAPIPPFTVLALAIYANWVDDKVNKEASSLSNLLGLFWVQLYAPRVTGSTPTQFDVLEEFPLIGIDTIKIRANWPIFLLAFIIGLISIGMSTIGLFEVSSTYLFIASVGASVTMIVCYFLLLERYLAKILTFTVIQNAFSISLRAATFFFYTDPPEAYPEGPHFSRQFFVGVMGAIGIVVAVLGVVIYATFMYKWTYRRMFFSTSLLFIITCIPNVILFRRLNVAWGIPDTVFVLGSEVVQVVVGQLNSMPFGVLMLSLCPPDIAATLYAIMAGSNNLGNSIAVYQGAFVLDQLNIKPTGNMTGESAQFDKLYIASAISLFIQIIPLFFIHALIPDIRQTEDLLPSNSIELEEIDGRVSGHNNKIFLSIPETEIQTI